MLINRYEKKLRGASVPVIQATIIWMQIHPIRFHRSNMDRAELKESKIQILNGVAADIDRSAHIHIQFKIAACSRICKLDCENSELRLFPLIHRKLARS